MSTPVKLAFLALAYACGYRFIVIYILSAGAIYALIGDNTR